MAQLSITAAVATDIGRSRATNQDWAIAKQLSTGPQQELGPVWLLVVADGMGGHAAGEVASRVAVATLEGALEQSLPEVRNGADFEAVLGHAMAAAHAAVRARAGALSEDGNMGTTLTAALVVGGRLWIAHVGDSRAYLLRGNSIEQLTEDQSVPPNRLTQALGMGGGEILPELFSCELQEGDAVLLTSDGLHGALRPRDLHVALRTSPDAATVCRKLVGAARLRDGSDDITAACLAVGRAFARPWGRRWRRLVLGGALAVVLASIAVVGRLVMKPSQPSLSAPASVRLDLRVSEGSVSGTLVPTEAQGGPRVLVGRQPACPPTLPLRGSPDQGVVLIVETEPGGGYRWVFGRERGSRYPAERRLGVAVDREQLSRGVPMEGPRPPGCDRVDLFTGAVSHWPERVAFHIVGPRGRDVEVVLELRPQAAASPTPTVEKAAGAARGHSGARYRAIPRRQEARLLEARRGPRPPKGARATRARSRPAAEGGHRRGAGSRGAPTAPPGDPPAAAGLLPGAPGSSAARPPAATGPRSEALKASPAKPPASSADGGRGGAQRAKGHSGTSPSPPGAVRAPGKEAAPEKSATPPPGPSTPKPEQAK